PGERPIRTELGLKAVSRSRAHGGSAIRGSVRASAGRAAGSVGLAGGGAGRPAAGLARRHAPVVATALLVLATLLAAVVLAVVLALGLGRVTVGLARRLPREAARAHRRRVTCRVSIRGITRRRGGAGRARARSVAA